MDSWIQIASAEMVGPGWGILVAGMDIRGGLPVARWRCKELRNEDEEGTQAADWFEGERERPAVVVWCMTWRGRLSRELVVGAWELE